MTSQVIDPKTPKKIKLFAGVDDGFAETKIVLSNGKVIRIPSQVKAGEMNQISISGSATTVFSYGTDEGRYVIGDIREADSTAFDDYPISAMNRVVVAHALRKAGVPANAELYICSGLPINKFYLSGKINQKTVKAKRQNLMKNDVVAMDGALFGKVVKHDVVSEGISAWMDIVLERNEHGKLGFNAELVSERIAIIDIGGRTTDIAVIHGGSLDTGRSSTKDIGMLAVRDTVYEAIYNKFEIQPSVEQMNDVMENKRIKLYGEYHAVENIVESAKRTTVARIESEVKKCLGNASDLDRIVFVGGTVVEIENYLDGWFRQQTIGHDPSFANARGMQKYAEMMMSKL